METPNIYSILSHTPLFTGMGIDELKRLVGKTKISFLKFAPGEIIARQGDKCGQLIVLISGSLVSYSSTDDGRYSVTENITAPELLETEFMFGLFQRFTHTFTATTQSSLISIDKSELLKISASSVIFRLNVANSLSTSLQKIIYETWRPAPADLGKRIIIFFRHRVFLQGGAKTFHIKMSTLAQELNDKRINISRALNSLQDKGVLKLYRGRIEIPSMQKLLAEL